MQEYTVELTKTARDNLSNIAAYIEELAESTFPSDGIAKG